MLHLRVISPPEQTQNVRRLLVREPGATHVAVLPAAAIEPAGDIVEADIAREAADEVLQGLRELGVDCSGGITLINIEVALSEAANAAEESAGRSGGRGGLGGADRAERRGVPADGQLPGVPHDRLHPGGDRAITDSR